MPQTQPAIAIGDDGIFVQRALARWLSTAGWQSLTFPSAEAFLCSLACKRHRTVSGSMCGCPA
jgi:FixJ family two-component response regulator